MNKFSAIIPSCGYGTRMNMMPNQSKELLINPDTSKPLIQWHIDLCKKYDIEPIFIVRPEKKDLISYLEKQQYKPILYSPNEGEEWMYTIYNNREYFSEKNILLLPDTTFSPQDVIVELKEHLEWLEFVLLLHEIPQNEQYLWGIYENEVVLEKPKACYSNLAWGVIGFDINCVDAFKELGETKKINLQKRVKYDILLNNFKDVTRGNK